MRVCFDTNTFIRIFSRSPAFAKIRQALLRGRITMLISNEILAEYREIIQQRSRFISWTDFAQFIETLQQLHGNVLEVSPQFRFAVIIADPDDN
jgi:uncharacterized protein